MLPLCDSRVPRQVTSVLALFCFVLVLGAALASGQKISKPGVKMVAATKQAEATSIRTALQAAPATISFSATDPDLGGVGGSSAATLTFTLRGGANNRTWTVSVQAGSSTFAGCTTIPAAAVTATCTSVNVSNLGTGACAAGSSLSTGAVTLASGSEGTGTDAFTISVKFVLNDSWRFIAQTSPTCPLTLNYALNAP